MRFELLHPADQLVMMMNRIYYGGMTTTSGGNLSIKDENGDLWITPSGVDKGALTRDDIMQVKPGGTILGRHQPSVEYPFHQSVYRRRPDIKAVLHAHSPGLVPFSIVRQMPPVNLIPNIKLICGKISIAPYAVPGSELLGEYVSAEFEKDADVVILENHGVVIGARDIFKAFMAFETLESCAMLAINASKLGKLKPLKPELMEVSTKKNVDMKEFVPDVHTSEENALRRDLIKLIHRSYEQGLFTSTQGTYSARLRDGSFLITPYGMDRKYLEVEDLVLIKDGKKELGKTPSRSVQLHQEIYERNSEIGSVLVAHPPNIMSFAVTETAFDPRTIPESYVLLRETMKLPFGMSYRLPKKTAGLICAKTPVLICENDCVIVTGSNLLNAFDRLEVAEFTAKSIIAACNLGDIVHINDDEIEEINNTFHLE